jgi:hypothetical protein
MIPIRGVTPLSDLLQTGIRGNYTILPTPVLPAVASMDSSQRPMSVMTGALVLDAFDDAFPSVFSILMSPGVLTNTIDLSPWSRHGVYQENGSVTSFQGLAKK